MKRRLNDAFKEFCKMYEERLGFPIPNQQLESMRGVYFRGAAAVFEAIRSPEGTEYIDGVINSASVASEIVAELNEYIDAMEDN